MVTPAVETSKLYNEILDRLDRVAKKENRLAFFYGVLSTLLTGLPAVLAAIILEEVFSFGVAGRTILFLADIAVVGGCIFWFSGKPALRLLGVMKSDDHRTVAVSVGRHFQSIRDRLLDALQMYESRDAARRLYSVELIDASFADLHEQMRNLNFSDAVSDRRVKRMRKFVTYAVGVCLLTFIVSPSGFLGSLHRIANYNTSFALPQSIRFVVEPGDAEAIRGDNLPVSVRVLGASPKQLALMRRPEGQLEFDSQILQPGGDGAFHTEFVTLKSSTEYYATLDDDKSSIFRISVIDRPLVRSLQLRVTAPPYTRIPPKIQDEGVGDVSAYPGSRIDFSIMASKELASSYLQFGDSSRNMLRVSGSKATGTLVVRGDKSYRCMIADRDGLSNLNPVEYSIKAIPDEYPTAEILSPAKNVELTDDMRLDLFIRIKDDFGFSRLRLAYRMVQSRYEQPDSVPRFIDIPLPQGGQALAEMPYHWDMSPLHLVPEDAIAYYVEVFDNDEVSGPKSGRSETYIVRLPSLEEVFSDVSSAQAHSMESLQDVAKQSEELKKNVDDLQREMRKSGQKNDWQQQKKAEDLMQRYESMKKNLEEASRKLDESVKKMEENKVLSDQTVQKYLDLQKLMDQLKSPELQEALKKLQESMKQMTPEQMRQAMEQVKFSEEQFRQSLERTIDLLKRIAIEQKVDEVLKRAEELKKEQEDLRRKTSETEEADTSQQNTLASQQQDLQKQEEELEKQEGDLEQKMQDFPKEMPLDEMAKAGKGLRDKQLQEKMSSAAQQMQSGHMNEARQNQQQAEEGLEQFEQQMAQVQKSMQDKQMKEVLNQMRKEIENLLELSRREESLKDETQSLDPNSRRFREAAEGQMEELNNLGNVASSMSEIAKKSFVISPEMGKEVGNAMRQMGEAMKSMENRNPVGTSSKQADAMGSLNRAAMMMQNAMNGLMQGGSSGMGMAALMQRLGQMTGAQSSINQGTQQAMGQGEGMSAQQMAEYQRLAGQQGAVQKSLEELSREAKNAGEYSRLLGDLDRTAQEMAEVQTDLEQHNVNSETLKKQERILSRLLDSQRSMRERDYEKRRKSEAGKDLLHPSPDQIDFTSQEGKNRLREELLKVLQGKYSKDYEELIRKYFELLEKEEVH